MRIVLTLMACGALAACAPTIPDSGAGVGFDNSLEAQRAREAALQGEPVGVLPPAAAISSEPLDAAGSAPASTDPLIARANAAIDAADPGAQAALGGAAAPQGLSDENDFSAVAERETIESDAQRLAQNRAAYTVVTPQPLPPRVADAQPNIVQYALETSHPRGERLYSRTGINLAARAQSNCRAYASPDQAQIAFLDRGGPERDRLNLDPDGDGYACAWDPAPFRAAVRN